jgi:Glycyl-tRNA synthetase alpha subunit/Glycyl-tRNA synthetase beta subunit
MRLPVPAYYNVLKCSHAFNVLDARGAVSATERATAFGRMRALARDVARLWADRRAELGYPLGVTPRLSPAAAPGAFGEVGSAQTALLEIGTEELPAAEVTRAAESLRAALAGLLDGARPARGRIRAFATPRRIVALVDEVAPRAPGRAHRSRAPGQRGVRRRRPADQGGARLRPRPINAFFDEVLVMSDDLLLRETRLGLLAAIRDLAAPVLDWDALGPLRAQ